MSLLALVPLLMVLTLQHTSTALSDTCAANANDPTCTSSRMARMKAAKQNKKRNLPMRPRDLPIDTIFSSWTDTDEFVELPLSMNQRVQVSSGRIQQNGDSDAFTSFYKLHNVVEDDEVLAILSTIKGDGATQNAGGEPTVVPLDDDPDTVDGMPTREIFIDNIELRKGEPSKGDIMGSPMRAQAKLKLREKMRKRLQEITNPILQERITPYIQQKYPKICGGTDPSRACTPCFSLIRRYVDEERTSHAIHHDGHALVTVVVSLSVRGLDYQGGLFVATKSAQRQYVGLSRGDAVVHRGDLYHGVKVLPANTKVPMDKNSNDGNGNAEGKETGGSAKQQEEQEEQEDTPGDHMERWSWILWYRDSDTCENYDYEWFAECAEEGNPTCELLHATKVPNIPNAPPEGVADSVLDWNQRASDHGHGGASIKLARAYLKLLPSRLVYSEKKAKELYHQAIRTSNHPEAHYGLACLLITKKARGRRLFLIFCFV